MKTESWVRTAVGGTVLRIVRPTAGVLVAAGSPLVVVLTDG